MKTLTKILIHALRNPRHYIESLNVKWRYIMILPLLASLAITLHILLVTDTVLDGFFADISNASQYIPEYTLEDESLVLADGATPLYYQSNFFQLVIDDTIENRGIQSYIPISKEKADLMADDIPLNLFLFKNQAVAVVGGIPRIINEYENTLLSQETLSRLMNSVTNQQFSMLSAVFLSYFVTSFIFYWIQMLLIALLAGIFNMRLSQPLPFKTRLKLTVVISFIPLVLIQLINSIFTNIQFGTYLLQVITLFLYYLALKDHTRFIRNLMEKFNIKKK